MQPLTLDDPATMVAFQKPCCPACRTRMTLTRIEFRSDGFDYRIFACATCDSVQTAAVASDAKKSNPLDWLKDRFLRPE